ncbi:MAG: hypothetical protein KME30_19025 [Iphinoe sp. HA4291-MV1]|nr:hypothetical protein [Iphinoe sp. HA4291-MV1]
MIGSNTYQIQPAFLGGSVLFTIHREVSIAFGVSPWEKAGCIWRGQ